MNQQMRRGITGTPKGRTRRTVPMTVTLYEALRAMDVVREGYVVLDNIGRRGTSKIEGPMAVDENLARKLASAEFSLQEMKKIGSGTPGHATEIETFFASAMASLRSIAHYIAKHAAGWNRIEAWLRSLSPQQRDAWNALRDIKHPWRPGRATSR